MKKIFGFFVVFLIFIGNVAFSEENSTVVYNDMQIQKRVSDIGIHLLNTNKIDVRLVFVYDKKEKKIKGDPTLTRRQIVVYDEYIQFAKDDAEIAAFLAREISKGVESYNGFWKGFLSSVQVTCAPKKYEILFDKRAIDYMVTAGYNPLAMLTYMNKSFPQKRYDRFARTNLTSKRLANIYEYIYLKYPIFLVNNEYLENPDYQNFLLVSQENRKKLHQKIKSDFKEKIKYE